MAVGAVDSVLNVAATLTLSIATPSSDPGVSTSVQRIQIDAPGFSESPVIVALIVVRHGAALPSVGPATVAQLLPGDVKFKSETATNPDVLAKSFAVVLYELRDEGRDG